ncbi:hypothetical protein CsSME_00036522 [Camellia sinensis var. sinensis]
MAKAKTTVSVMAGLLMEGTVLGSIILGLKWIRERLRVKEFEMALSYENLESFGQGHVKGIEGAVTSPGRIDRGVGRC